MENRISVLDHGFVILRNLSGPTRRTLDYDKDGNFEYPFDADDVDPARTARISFDNLDKERSVEQDHKLYEYLIKNHHNTPIEMIETWWEMKLPIFVARQFVRHRTACINEISARYAVLPEEWYIPDIVGGRGKSNKQGQEDNLPDDLQRRFKESLDQNCARSYRSYLDCIKEGVAPEHARLFLHVNHYTHWVWKQDLSNLMHFLSLRLHPHAQVEARVYAQAMYDLLVQYLPKSMECFDKYKRL